MLRSTRRTGLCTDGQVLPNLPGCSVRDFLYLQVRYKCVASRPKPFRVPGLIDFFTRSSSSFNDDDEPARISKKMICNRYIYDVFCSSPIFVHTMTT